MAARNSRGKARVVSQHGFLGRLLDPIDRLSETIYSVLILLTFTLAFRIIRLGPDPGAVVSSEYVNELLVAAVGAIVAWGIIDGIMYVLIEVFQRGERHRMLRLIQAAENEEHGVAIVANELDYILEPITDDQERRALYRNVFAHLRKGQPRPIGFKREDFAGAFGSLLVAVFAVLPSLAPFVLLRNDYALAIRVSNIVSFVVLFYTGYQWGRYTGVSPWRTGLMLVAVGVLMVAVAIPLGG
jgi:VIT1/CCC1 family predicted Fe2+/Mn2+ transporter